MDKAMKGVVEVLGARDARERERGGSQIKKFGRYFDLRAEAEARRAGGDRKSALYLLQCRMGLIPLADAIKK